MPGRMPQPPMAWDAWGDPGRATELTPDMLGLITTTLRTTTPRPGVARDQVRLRSSTLTSDDVAALATVVGADSVTVADADRLLRAGGKSTLDLLRRKQAGEQDAPDGVVAPASDDEVAGVLAVCAERGIAVVPFGGGTSVVGGLDPVRGPFRAAISLDLARFDRLEELDTVDGVAQLGAGLTGPAAEALLAAEGYELGHYPQSFRYATIGGFAATRSSGQDSAGYGRFDDMVVGLRVVTPRGVMVLGRPGPKDAAGPDLRQLFLGSEGTFGVITSVRLRVHPVPEATLHEAWQFPDFAAGAAALRAVQQRGAGPTVVRLSDETETALNLATVSDAGGADSASGCLAITVFEGEPELAAARRAATGRIMTEFGGTSLGPERAERWAEHRFDGPYLRDPLLAAGVLVETLETVTSWSRLASLKAAVTERVTAKFAEYDSPAIVLCHISHVYAAGASLYFTIVGAQRGEGIDAAIAQWSDIKASVNDVLVSAGGSITHHHAVGTDHRPWMEAQVGALGVEVLRAVKATLDPGGILNPGKLIP